VLAMFCGFSFVIVRTAA